MISPGSSGKKRLDLRPSPRLEVTLTDSCTCRTKAELFHRLIVRVFNNCVCNAHFLEDVKNILGERPAAGEIFLGGYPGISYFFRKKKGYPRFGISQVEERIS